jgi:hypothetical protein
MPRFEDAIETAGSLVLHALVKLYHSVEVCVYGRNPTYETMAWSLHDNDGYKISVSDYHELDIGSVDSNFILHDVRKTLGFHQVHKIAIHWTDGQHWRAPYKLAELFIAPPPPWLYIGFGEDADNLTDCTEELNCLIAYDNRVTTEVLTSLLPASEGAKWFYINPKTFDTAEFPADGILIDDPPATEDQPSTSTKDD